MSRTNCPGSDPHKIQGSTLLQFANISLAMSLSSHLLGGGGSQACVFKTHFTIV